MKHSRKSLRAVSKQRDWAKIRFRGEFTSPAVGAKGNLHNTTSLSQHHAGILIKIAWSTRNLIMMRACKFSTTSSLCVSSARIIRSQPKPVAGGCAVMQTCGALMKSKPQQTQREWMSTNSWLSLENVTLTHIMHIPLLASPTINRNMKTTRYIAKGKCGSVGLGMYAVTEQNPAEFH
jgi:hypothetical protein